MGIEIEHKYLVNQDLFPSVSNRSKRIKQGYITTDPKKTVRVRTIDTEAYITVKGETLGATRLEYEYRIPIKDAQEMLDNFCQIYIDKIRNYVEYKGHTWEVDIFLGTNSGLVIAEIELPDENTIYELPDWVGENVTNDMRYANSNLINKPYFLW